MQDPNETVAELPLALIDYTNERWENHPGAEARTNTPEAIILGLRAEIEELEQNEERLEQTINALQIELSKLRG